MRHLLGLVAGVVLAPLLLVATAWSTASLDRESFLFDDPPVADSAGPFAVVVLSGLAVGVLVCSRVSPLACLPAAALFVVPVVLWWLAEEDVLLGLLPPRNRISTGVRDLAESGTGLALAAALVVPALLPSRWRGGDRR